MKRFKNILFFTDRDEGLISVLSKVIALSNANDAWLTIIDVTPDSGLADYINQAYHIDLNAQLREQRLQALKQIKESYNDMGVPVNTRLVTGTLHRGYPGRAT